MNNEKWVNDVCEILENREYPVNRGVLESIFRTSYNQKKHLWDLFSQHPGFNPEGGYIVIPQYVEKRRINSDAVNIFIREMEYHFGYESIQAEKLDQLRYLTTDRLGENFAACLNDSFSEYGMTFRKEQSIKKVINNIFTRMGWKDEWENYGREWARMCDGLVPYQKELQLVISLNPIDYLLMSNGTSWHSCHNIERYGEDGCYCAGTLSYMVDPDSFVVYSIHKDVVDNGDLYKTPKHSRQMWGLSEDSALLFQSRLYPQSCDEDDTCYSDIAKIVNGVISSVTNQSYDKVDFNKYKVKKGMGACNYADWKEGAPGCTSVRLFASKEISQCEPVHMGAQPFDIYTGDLYCRCESLTEKTYYKCDFCGEWEDEDELIYTASGDRLCRECAKGFACSVDTYRYYPIDTLIFIEGVGYVTPMTKGKCWDYDDNDEPYWIRHYDPYYDEVSSF